LTGIGGRVLIKYIQGDLTAITIRKSPKMAVVDIPTANLYAKPKHTSQIDVYYSSLYMKL